jgi:hypothetical protein
MPATVTTANTNPRHAEAAAVRQLGLPVDTTPGTDHLGFYTLPGDPPPTAAPDWSHPPAISLPRSTSRVAFWRRQITSAWRFGVICGFVPGLLMGAGAVAALITLGRMFGA